MGMVSYIQSSFLGGEWSQAAQGRMDDPHYRTALDRSLNGFPTETGAWTRAGGTQFLGATRGGKPGKLIAFDVEEATPLNLEFTDGFLRVRDGTALATTNDSQAVIAISAANPAVVQVAAAWPSGATVMFSGLGVNNPLLQNRAFAITNVDATHFSLQDALTGANIDGATLGAFVSGTVSRLLEIATSYTAGSWASLRSVQAETQAILLNGAAPQVLTMLTPPRRLADATFALAAANFLDGPYLDAFAGSICTYDAQQGNVTLTFSFQAWLSTTSYSAGDYAVSAGVSYQSLQNANLNNPPATSPAFWNAVNGGAPVGPNGFTSGDIGRHIRLFSEPALWSAVATYAANAVVKYNDTYWQSLIGSNTGIIPGTSPTAWALVTGINYAQWTWGRIISVSGSGLAVVGTPIGNMTAVAQAFNGSISQASGNCAQATNTQSTGPQWADNTGFPAGQVVYYQGNLYQAGQRLVVLTPGQAVVAGTLYVYPPTGGTAGALWMCNTSTPVAPAPPDGLGIFTYFGTASPYASSPLWTWLGVAPDAKFDVYAGADFSAAAKVVQSVTIFGSNDLGFTSHGAAATFNLRAKQGTPAGPSDGTLLGTVAGTTGPLSITSINQHTAWKHVWVEMIVDVPVPLPDDGSHSYTITGYVAQIEIFTPNVNNGSVVTVQLVGPPLLYPPGTVVNTWRAGAYANTTGWPSCGCYHEGRLGLGGAIANRWDFSVANDLFNFAPTGPDGTVADDNAINFTADSDGVNATFWMAPDALGVIVGTQAGEWLIQSTQAGLPITPANIQAHRVTKAKCANIEPQRTEHTLVAVQARQRKIFEYFADVFSGKFSAPNLMEKARHLTGPLIEEIRYQQELTPTIWARLGDGSLIGGVYRRDTLMTSQGPTFMGWFRIALGSGRVVESISVGPSQNGTLDAIIMITNDPLTGVRHVELIADYFEETDSYANAWLLHDAVQAASYQVSGPNLVINGLWHLNGKTVTVFAAGLDCGDFTVANGTVTVPFGDGIAAGTANGQFTAAFVNGFPPLTMPLVVGFTYTSQGRLVRPATPAETGARAGPGAFKRRRHHRFGIQCVNTNGLSVGTDFLKLNPVLFRSVNGPDSYPLPALFSGAFQDNIRDDSTLDGQLCWQVTRPVPAMIAALGGMIETQDV